MTQLAEDKRFEFGKNWQSYLASSFSEERLNKAHGCMLTFLGCADLQGKTFLDIGCGSGIHSLAALKAGAKEIISFDYDNNSVEATRSLWKQAGTPSHWQVMQGSVLDDNFIGKLPSCDIVYSWGVLHHTGNQWKALDLAQSKVKRGGQLFIALYSSDKFSKRKQAFWLKIKKLYVNSNVFVQQLLTYGYMAASIFVLLLRGKNPIKVIQNYKESRGMEFIVDVRDWLGGWPMEFSSANEVVGFLCRGKGFYLTNINMGEANTEYLFIKP